MSTPDPGLVLIERKVIQLFALVSEALARATEALLGLNPSLGQSVIDGDQDVDALTSEVEMLVWDQLNARPVQGAELRYMVALLLIIPELERSADLAEHIAQRAVNNLGRTMSPTSRGIVQQMSDVALQMWSVAADSFTEGISRAEELVLADDEIDALRDRLIEESKRDSMANETASQVAMLARFYERLGD